MATSGLDKLVTIEAKDWLLSEVLAAISSKTGVRCTCDSVFGNVKTTVFAKDVKARDVLDRLCDDFMSKLRFDGGAYEMKDSPERRSGTEYALAEARYLAWRLLQRLQALSDLSLQNNWSPATQDEAPLQSDDETVEHWARRFISQPAYRVAALWYRWGRPASFEDRLWDAAGVFEVGSVPRGCLIQVPSGGEAVDAATAPLLGYRITLAWHQTTGELRLESLNAGKVRNDPYLDRPYRYAKPPKQLADQSFAKLLKAWDTPVDKLPPALLRRKVEPLPEQEEENPKSPEFFGGKVSLGDELETLYRETGIPIVSTSFRTPALSPKLPVGDEAETIIRHLAKEEECFLHSEGGFLEVRHPAFWVLGPSEPPEGAVRELEAIAARRTPGLLDYARLAAAMQLAGCGDLPSLGSEVWQVNWSRWVDTRGILVQFDPGPIASAFPPLVLLGAMSDFQQSAFTDGTPFNLAKLRSTMRDSMPGGLCVAAHQAPLYDAITTARMLWIVVGPFPLPPGEWPPGVHESGSIPAPDMWLTDSGGRYVFNFGYAGRAPACWYVMKNAADKDIEDPASGSSRDQ